MYHGHKYTLKSKDESSPFIQFFKNYFKILNFKRLITVPSMSKIKILVTHNLSKPFQLTRLTYHSILLCKSIDLVYIILLIQRLYLQLKN